MSSLFQDSEGDFTPDEFFEPDAEIDTSAGKHKRTSPFSFLHRHKKDEKPRDPETAAAEKAIKRARRREAAYQIRHRFGFILSIILVLAGGLSILFMYIQVYLINNEVNQLSAQLTELQTQNEERRQNNVASMNMTELYGYATNTLGMVEADQSHTIIVKVSSSSYTTSNLPVSDTVKGKVTFHWFD